MFYIVNSQAFRLIRFKHCKEFIFCILTMFKVKSKVGEFKASRGRGNYTKLFLMLNLKL